MERIVERIDARIPAQPRALRVCAYVAQIAVFAAEAEPFWLNNEICPQGAETQFSMFDSRFSLCPAGCVSRYSKQGTCTASSPSKRLFTACSLGASP